LKFFQEYKKYIPEAQIAILGKGNAFDDIKKYVEENDMDVKFLGESTNVYSIMNNYDIIMGMGRCILEAIAMKKIAIISGYTSVGGLINKDNIELASKENFTDRYNNQDDKFKETLQKLISLTNDDINRITKENYDFAYKNLNYKKNIFVIDDKNILEYVAISNQTVFNLFSNSITHYENIINIKTKQIEKLKYENSTLLQEQIVDLQSGNNILQNEIELLQNKIKGLQNENILLRDELECIYNSRRWKYSSALAKLIKKH